MRLHKNGFRVALLRSVCVVGLAGLSVGTAGAAWAQDAAPVATTPAPNTSAPAAQDSDTIVVTGSRIPRPDYAFSNPVTSIDSKSIEYSGITDVTDLMQRVPALVGSFNSSNMSGGGEDNFIGGTGLNLLNLRNLGVERTLVLVNGRRHVSGLAGDAAVDTNTIPVDLIKRVEVLTGGASAVYGADGVSGVVNFIMRDDFEGARARFQGSTTDAGGAGNQFGSLTLGTNFADNRGNIAVSVEYNHDERLRSQQRDFSNHEVRFVQNDGTINSPYDQVPLGNLGWFESGRGGAIDANFDFTADFDGNTDGPWDDGVYPGGLQSFTYQQGGSATPTSNYSGDLLPDIKRYDVNIFGHYDLTPTTRFFTELKYVQTRSFSISQPTFDYFLAIDPDNFYLQQHPDIVAAAAGNDAADFGLATGTVLMTRDNFDLGVRAEDIKRETWRGVWGFDGSLGAWGEWHASYTYGQTTVDNNQINDRLNDRFAAAIDAVDDGTGHAVCRSNLDPSAIATNVDWQGLVGHLPWPAPTSFTPGPNSGCVPIDLFGDGSVSQAARDWIMQDGLAVDKITQSVASAYIDGDLDPLFRLPGGSVGYSLGAEWRRETSASTPALIDQEGLTYGNQIPPSFGAFEVSEVFGELSIPILQDAPFADTLSVDLADRYSHYTTIGETNTWKIGGVWAPIHDFRFRATHAIAVRAPNIGELFGAAGQDFEHIIDPCDIGQLQFGTPNRAANCATLLTAAGADPTTFQDPNQGITVPGLLGSNPNLQEEKATTDTFGFVVQPRALRGLAFSVDYYKIDLQNAINTLLPQDIVDQCVDLPTADNQFCALITRQNGGQDAGGIISFVRQPVNVASFTTKGEDFSVSYVFALSDFGVKQDLGSFALRLVGNHLDDLTFVNLPGAAPDPDKGEKTAPEWQINFDLTWDKGPWTVNYSYQYFSKTVRFSTSSADEPPQTTAPEFVDYNALSEHDIQVRFAPTDAWTVYAGVNDIGDQLPDLAETAYPVGPKGREFYVGFTANWGGAGN
ncbi:MAG: TonB-dependent receptor [Alphaproteobacteria bacterium]